MKIIYCKEWALFKKQPHDIITEQEAKNRYSKKESYVAVLYENNTLKYVVEIDGISETVRFYDDNLDNYLLYSFVKKGENMFLNTAYYYCFKEGKKVEHVYFNFKENGEMVAEKRDYIEGRVEGSEGTVDVSCNWERIPDFGEYNSVIRIDRV